jgi:hypothetical protein
MNRRERKLIAKKAGIDSHNIGVMLPPTIFPLIREYPKIGRNDPCPCGKFIEKEIDLGECGDFEEFSKKRDEALWYNKSMIPVKYKNCCMRIGIYENYK